MVGEQSALRVEISPDAARYILDHGGEAMIRFSPRHGCCGGTAWLPVIHLGRPSDLEVYRQVREGDVVVYIQREIAESTKRPLKVGVDGLWQWRKLWVEGAEPRL